MNWVLALFVSRRRADIGDWRTEQERTMKIDCMRQMNRLALCIAVLGGVLVGCSDKEDDMAMCINDTTLRLSDRETPVLCAIACVDGSCVPCKNGAVECRDGAIYTCVDDAWKKYKDWGVSLQKKS